MRVKNRSWSPMILSIPKTEGANAKNVALAGRRSVDITEAQMKSPEIRRLLRSGELFLIPEKGHTPKKAAKKASKKGVKKDA